MYLKDLLKKKSDIEKGHIEKGHGSKAKRKDEEEKKAPAYQTEFTFLRTTTVDQEVIEPPSFPGDNDIKYSPHHAPVASTSPGANLETPKKQRRLSIFHRTHSHSSVKSVESIPESPPPSDAIRPGLSPRKLSERLSSLRLRSSSRSSVSSNLPSTLEPSPCPVSAPLTPDSKKRIPTTSDRTQEALWETRATQLAMSAAVTSSARSSSPYLSTPDWERSPEQQAQDEAQLQQAIQLHESGALPESTDLFASLASPKGANSALAQVLYGLALRHGWGIDPDEEKAHHFLSLAAATSGTIEAAALKAGSDTGGAAKGELVLAIFELGNCYRYGWGTGKDPVAAREYYEVAANLGDADALEEAAWCCLEGFGGPKDAHRAAGYLRRAEESGRRQVGNSWIWKEKYHPVSRSGGEDAVFT